MYKILVVEDDRMIRENVMALLESENFEVLEAENGKKAISILNDIKPDLIISDIMMPEIDGYELLKYIQSSDGLNDIPFIFLTSKNDEIELRIGMNWGADDYLTKPYKSEDLLKTIKVRLRKKEIYNNEVMQLKEHILHDIPHELRTPLITIFGYSDLILDEIQNLDKDEIKGFIGLIKGAGERLFKIIKRI